MTTIPIYEYLEYTVVLATLTNSNDEHTSIFSVYHGNPRGEGIRPLDLVHQEGRDAAETFASVEYAQQQAADRAREWIDKSEWNDKNQVA